MKLITIRDKDEILSLTSETIVEIPAKNFDEIYKKGESQNLFQFLLNTLSENLFEELTKTFLLNYDGKTAFVCTSCDKRCEILVRSDVTFDMDKIPECFCEKGKTTHFVVK